MLVNELSDQFFTWLKHQVLTGKLKQSTITYYEHQLRCTITKTALMDAGQVKPLTVELACSTWHQLQAAKRLWTWATNAELIDRNPLHRLRLPSTSPRTATLDSRDQVRLLRACRPHLRQFALAMRETCGRPQELRALRWCHRSTNLFGLAEFKAKARRRDAATHRWLPITPRFHRLLNRLTRRRQPAAGDFVLLNSYAKPWTKDAIVKGFARARQRIHLPELVAYTWRHTRATEAALGGMNQLALSSLLGHTNPRTTARYFHPRPADLVALAASITRKQPPCENHRAPKSATAACAGAATLPGTATATSAT